MNYADFESHSKPENNGKIQMRLIETKYQNHVGCSCGYKLVCVNDQFSKPFKSYLGQYSGLKLICSTAKVVKYCSCVMKNQFNKNLL